RLLRALSFAALKVSRGGRQRSRAPCLIDMPSILILAQSSSGILDSAKETADTFGWNPWLFFSQVISFVIVALLLRRFAYKPILKILEERREQIAAGLLNAEKIKQQLAEAEQRQAENLAK